MAQEALTEPLIAPGGGLEQDATSLRLGVGNDNVAGSEVRTARQALLQRPILIVEDDEDLAASIAEFLDCSTFSSEIVQTVDDAWQYACVHKPWLVIVDVQLGDEDGLELIRKHRKFDDVTTYICMTGNSQESCIIEALKLGVYDFLKKPFKPELLIAVIERALDHQVEAQVRSMMENEVRERARDLESLVVQLEAANEQIAFMADHDHLTFLLNKTKFFDLARNLISENKARKAVFSVAIEEIGKINNYFGNDFADRFLKAVALELVQVFPAGTKIARLEGGHFVGLVGLDGSDGVSERLCQDLIEWSKRSRSVLDIIVQSTIAIGFAEAPEDGTDPELLVKRARVAARTVTPYTAAPQLRYNADLAREEEFETWLRQAVRAADSGSGLNVHYQPKIDLRTGRVLGAEALVRWTHPEIGAISPARFIPIAECTGEILRIGDWVLRTSCLVTRMIRSAIAPEFVIAVNLSPVQLMLPQLEERVVRVLDEVGLEPEALELEITEGSIVRQDRKTLDALRGLRSHGISLSIDDFGTGYSSLSYIKHLPVTALKIDRAFVSDAHRDDSDRRLCQSIVGIGHDFGLKVVAEGIEEEAHTALLREIGCDIGQGFLFGKPMDQETLMRFLRDQLASQDGSKGISET